MAVEAVADYRRAEAGGVGAVDAQLVGAPGKGKQLYTGETSVIISYPVFRYGVLAVIVVYLLVRPDVSMSRR